MENAKSDFYSLNTRNTKAQISKMYPLSVNDEEMSIEEQLTYRCRGIQCSRARRCVCSHNNQLFWKYKAIIEAAKDRDTKDEVVKAIAQQIRREKLKKTKQTLSRQVCKKRKH